MESSFRADLGSVRVHRGPTAATASDRLGAKAFAFGPNIFLGSGARPDDLGLMAHEAAHTIQQGAAPVLQPFGLDPGDSYEREAHQASEAVLRGEPFHVVGRTAAPCVQRVGIRAVFDYVANAANDIPGFPLLTYAMAMNPFNMRPVERNATNLFRAIIGFLPGGNYIFEALQRHGILERVGAWLEQQLGALRLGGRSFRDAFDRFLSSLGLWDLAHPGRVWQRARRMVTDPIGHAIGFVRGFVGGILSAIRAAILRPVARLAQGTRGYDLLRLVLAQDPITGDPYPRSAENMIGGFMRLIGEEEKWRHLQEARAIPRAWAWFQAQIGTLMGFVREIPQLFSRLWQSLEISDLLDIGGAFNRVRGIFGEFASRFFTWAGTAALEVMMFIFEAVAPGAMPVLRRAASVIGIIVREPIRFVGNLVRAGRRGFEQFRGNIRQHLVNGLVGWLTGALSTAGLQLPTRGDARGILSLVLQVLNLTWPNIRVKLVRVMGETAVAALETTFDLVMTLVREGPAAAWQKILEHLQNLREMVFGRIRDWVTRTVVGQAVVRILSMLNPAGAVIQAIIAIYDTIIFFRDRLQQIRQVAESFFNSIAEIAAGNIRTATNRVEQTMGRFVPVVISFLAGLIRLGGISGEIRNIITRLRAPIDQALNRVVDWIAAQARRLASRALGGNPNAPPQERLDRAMEEAGNAVRRLSGSEVGLVVLRPVLLAVRARHNLQSLEAVAREDRWVLIGRINPTREVRSDKRVAAGAGSRTSGATRPEISVGVRIELRHQRRGGDPTERSWSRTRYDVTEVMSTHIRYSGGAGSAGMLTFAAYGTSWRRFVPEAGLLAEEQLRGENARQDWGTNFAIARCVLNYRHHAFQMNPPEKDWEHLIEQSARGPNSSENLALADRRLNQVDLNHWFGSRQGSAPGFPATGRLTVREYLSARSASGEERKRWKLRSIRNFNKTLRWATMAPRGRYQLID